MAKTYFLLSPNVIPKFLKIDVDVLVKTMEFTSYFKIFKNAIIPGHSEKYVKPTGKTVLLFWPFKDLVRAWPVFLMTG